MELKEALFINKTWFCFRQIFVFSLIKRPFRDYCLFFVGFLKQIQERTRDD